MRGLVHVGLLAPAAFAAVPRISPSQALADSISSSLVPLESEPVGLDESGPAMRLLSPDPQYPVDSRASPFCTWWYNYEGQPWEPSCLDMPELASISLLQWHLWEKNPILAESCDNYQPFNSYCIEAFHHPEPEPTGPTPTSPPAPPTTTRPTTTTTTAATTTGPGNGITTPTPIQEGMTRNCNKFQLIRSTTTCLGVLEENSISFEQFFRWNPSVGATCQNLWTNTHACVGVIPGTEPPTTTAPGNGIATPTPIQPGMVTNCNKFQPVRETTTCDSIVNWTGITFADLLRWNPGIGSKCQSLWKGTHACVGVIGGTPPSTTTTTGNGITTPTPIQPGMVTNCNKFQPVRETTTCDSIVNWTGITFAQLLRWNPGIGSNCQTLWVGTHACVGVIQDSTPTVPGNGIVTPSPVQGGIPTNCNKFQPVRETTTCDSIINYNKITKEDFHSWNPQVGTNCQNLRRGADACVGVIDNTAANGIPTPLPIQPDMATNCNKFQPVRSTTTCDSIINYNKITWAEFYSWNPNVGANCQNLRVDTNSCVGVVNNTPRNGIVTPTPNQPGMATNCNAFANIRPTTTCQGVLDWNKISLADFVKWNPGVGSSCGNLWANSFACIGVIGGNSSPTQPGNQVTTPTPTQPGMISGCTAFATIRPTTTCQGVLDWNKITLANFVRWNPAVGSNCQNLWANTWACIAGP